MSNLNCTFPGLTGLWKPDLLKETGPSPLPHQAGSLVTSFLLLSHPCSHFCVRTPKAPSLHPRPLGRSFTSRPLARIPVTPSVCGCCVQGQTLGSSDTSPTLPSVPSSPPHPTGPKCPAPCAESACFCLLQDALTRASVALLWSPPASDRPQSSHFWVQDLPSVPELKRASQKAKLLLC